MNEIEKYIEIYAGDIGKNYENRHNEGYGRGFWGKNAIPFIKKLNTKSVCDVGCGYGRFCDSISEFVETVYGVDIASVKTQNIIDNKKINWIDAEAKSIPLPDNAVEWLTSFDCLEHCLPNDIDIILNEFNRIATKGFIFSISYVDDRHLWLKLHMTVKNEDWWLDKFQQYGTISRGEFIGESSCRYIIITKD